MTAIFSKFVPGLEVCEKYFVEVVEPLITTHFPDLKYAAGLMGHGSEVLGFDIPQSMDHDWGPRTLLFLSNEDLKTKKQELDTVMQKYIPKTFLDYPTSLLAEGKRFELRVEVHSVDSYFKECIHEKNLTLDPHKELDSIDWLVLPQQELLVLTGGKVFRDDLGELTAIRKKLEYYPHEVWLFILAAQWRRIGQEEPFVGRAADAGDDLGSQVIAARMVREVMRLCFMMEKKYIPYSKHFGRGFQRLACAKDLTPILRSALMAGDFPIREKYMSEAYEYVARMHNSLGITDPVPTKVSKFVERPYLIIHAEDIDEAIKKKISDPQLRNLKIKFGAVDQFADDTDFLTNFTREQKPFKKIRALYDD
jgi:hypothetical protein